METANFLSSDVTTKREALEEFARLLDRPIEVNESIHLTVTKLDGRMVLSKYVSPSET